MGERNYKDIDGNAISLDLLVKKEPGWAANRIRHQSKQIAELKIENTRRMVRLAILEEAVKHMASDLSQQGKNKLSKILEGLEVL